MSLQGKLQFVRDGSLDYTGGITENDLVKSLDYKIPVPLVLRQDLKVRGSGIYFLNLSGHPKSYSIGYGPALIRNNPLSRENQAEIISFTLANQGHAFVLIDKSKWLLSFHEPVYDINGNPFDENARTIQFDGLNGQHVTIKKNLSPETCRAVKYIEDVQYPSTGHEQFNKIFIENATQNKLTTCLSITNPEIESRGLTDMYIPPPRKTTVIDCKDIVPTGEDHFTHPGEVFQVRLLEAPYQTHLLRKKDSYPRVDSLNDYVVIPSNSSNGIDYYNVKLGEVVVTVKPNIRTGAPKNVVVNWKEVNILEDLNIPESFYQ